MNLKKTIAAAVLGTMLAVPFMGFGPQVLAANTQQNPPQMQNGQQAPEPPKDENGNPLPPPDGPGHGQIQNGQQPPEPPKDENGNPLPPPDGAKAPATGSPAAS